MLSRLPLSELELNERSIRVGKTPQPINERWGLVVGFGATVDHEIRPGQFKSFFGLWVSPPPTVCEGTRAAVVVPLHDVAAAGADLTGESSRRDPSNRERNLKYTNPPSRLSRQVSKLAITTRSEKGAP